MQDGEWWPGQTAMDDREVVEFRETFGMDYAEYT
jgi:hypothetical protein